MPRIKNTLRSPRISAPTNGIAAPKNTLQYKLYVAEADRAALALFVRSMNGFAYHICTYTLAGHFSPTDEPKYTLAVTTSKKIDKHRLACTVDAMISLFNGYGAQQISPDLRQQIHAIIANN